MKFSLGIITMAAAAYASSEIAVPSKLGRQLLSSARRLEDQGVDFSFVSGYSIKFQGCHHISQWNEDAEDDDDVRIQTKRLVRFRLCPSGNCASDKSSGCSGKYGDYIVDMNTYVAALLEAEADEKEYTCDQYEEECNDMCDGEDDDCLYNCYANYEVEYCTQQDDDDDAFDPSNYAACAQYEFPDNGDDMADDAGRRRLDEDVAYYVGPYCAQQGGEIRLGLFSDDTCTSFISGGKDTFYAMAGFALPYSSASLVSSSCMTCEDPDADEEDDEEEAEAKEVCQDLYQSSGKCESKMYIDYPNESACTYIEGIKIIREDGVIRTTSTRKSKSAAVAIGLFTTVGVLLGAYVYYLRTKLGRAKINLSAGSMG